MGGFLCLKFEPRIATRKASNTGRFFVTFQFFSGQTQFGFRTHIAQGIQIDTHSRREVGTPICMGDLILVANIQEGIQPSFSRPLCKRCLVRLFAFFDDNLNQHNLDAITVLAQVTAWVAAGNKLPWPTKGPELLEFRGFKNSRANRA